jgi:hypothetical protein
MLQRGSLQRCKQPRCNTANDGFATTFFEIKIIVFLFPHPQSFSILERGARVEGRNFHPVEGAGGGFHRPNG